MNYDVIDINLDKIFNNYKFHYKLFAVILIEVGTLKSYITDARLLITGDLCVDIIKYCYILLFLIIGCPFCHIIYTPIINSTGPIRIGPFLYFTIVTIYYFYLLVFLLKSLVCNAANPKMKPNIPITSIYFSIDL